MTSPLLHCASYTRVPKGAPERLEEMIVFETRRENVAVMLIVTAPRRADT